MQLRNHSQPAQNTDTHVEDGFHWVTLSELHTGRTGLVRQLLGGRLFMVRAAALGFTPGAEIRVEQNIGRGPMIVTVCGARLALGRGEACKIQVEVL